jgi:hypothetical protein
MGWGHAHRMRHSARGRLTAFAGAALAAALVLAPQQALAKDTASARTQISIQTPGSMVKIQDMNFGNIAQTSGTATILMSPQQNATCTVTGAIIRTGPCQGATFSVVGRKNWIVRIREQNGGTVTLTGPGGATMTMNALTIGVNPAEMTAINGGGQSAGLFGRWRIDNNSGISNFSIGGTLNVGVAQAFGVYHGTLLIQVQYN